MGIIVVPVIFIRPFCRFGIYVNLLGSNGEYDANGNPGPRDKPSSVPISRFSATYIRRKEIDANVLARSEGN